MSRMITVVPLFNFSEATMLYRHMKMWMRYQVDLFRLTMVALSTLVNNISVVQHSWMAIASNEIV